MEVGSLELGEPAFSEVPAQVGKRLNIFCFGSSSNRKLELSLRLGARPTPRSRLMGGIFLTEVYIITPFNRLHVISPAV